MSRTRSASSPGRRAAAAGFSVLELAVAGGITMVVFFGAMGAVDTFHESSTKGREALRAVGDGYRANRRLAERMMTSIVADPESDLVVFDEDGSRVSDTNGTTSVAASGPIMRVVRQVGYRLNQGRVVAQNRVVEFRMDTAADLNGDGHTDQLLSIEDPDGSSPRYTVLSRNVDRVTFVKEGMVLKIVTESYPTLADRIAALNEFRVAAKPSTSKSQSGGQRASALSHSQSCQKTRLSNATTGKGRTALTPTQRTYRTHKQVKVIRLGNF